MGYYYGFDPTYLLVLIGAGLCMLASFGVQSTYRKYAKIRSMCGMTGAQVAKRILDQNHVTDVQIRHVPGNLTDHFDPGSSLRSNVGSRPRCCGT